MASPPVRKVLIEARINEYASRRLNSHVPWSPTEIADDARACVEAGASIIHFHAREGDGRPSHRYESYRDIVRRLKADSDVLINPTLGINTAGNDGRERLSHILRLIDDDLAPDIAPLDMVSTNFDAFDSVNRRFRTEESVYINSTGILRNFAETLCSRGVIPYAQIYSVPAMRQLDAFAIANYVRHPLFLSLLLTEGGAIAAHPGTAKGIAAYLEFLNHDRAPNWTVMLFGGNLLPLIPYIVAAGGNISIGIGDYAYPELDYPTNAALVFEAARIIRSCDVEVATPQEARQILKGQYVSGTG